MEVHLKTLNLIFLLTFSAASYDFVVKPEFGEKEADLNITAYVGQTSRLPCTVKHLSGKRVSWIRLRDLQVLSTGRHTFSTDLRISVLPGAGFKLRSPRNLYKQDPLYNQASQGMTESREDIRLHVKSDAILSTNVDSKRFDEERYLPSTVTNSRKGSTLLFGGETKKNKYESNTQKGKKTPRSISPSIDTRPNEDYLHKRLHQSQYFTFPSWYEAFSSSGADQRNSKKLMSFLNHQGYIQDKSLGILPASGNRDKAMKKENNPIAIYPQGPNSVGAESRIQKLAPNHLDGVWEPEDYTLQIKYTHPQDAGTYVCQINTEPKIAQEVVLRVVHMKAEILGRRELFVKAGNPVKLSCIVNHGAVSPGFILWYKGQRLVEYENSGGRIKVLMEAGGVSHLLLNNVQPEDSSNYTCSPAGGEPASLILSVIIDERQAAMHQGNRCTSINFQMSMTLLCATLLLGQILSCPLEFPKSVSLYLMVSIFVGVKHLISPWLVTATILAFLMQSLKFRGKNRNEDRKNLYSNVVDRVSRLLSMLLHSRVVKAVIGVTVSLWSYIHYCVNTKSV